MLYAGAAALTIAAARRWIGPIPRAPALLLILLPLVFTGKAMLLGRIYGPADLYFAHDPWKELPHASVERAANPILSDLAFANLPWRAAVREAVANGRLPLWNRFVLAGTPLLASAQAGVLHPSTWFGIALPVALSWTFSCAFTLFLALLCGYLYFSDFRLSPAAALLGAVGWGFSTEVLFWLGWSVGPSLASLPLLLLGLRRIARGSRGGVGVTVTALLLCFFGGHPETFAHELLVAAIAFLWELFGNRALARPALLRAAGAGLLALFFAAPQLLPLLEAIPHSAEYRKRHAIASSGRSVQSVPAREAAARLLPAALPFAHGIYGKSAVQAERADGSGMPLAYAGALLFPLAAIALVSRRSRERGRSWFAGAAIAGVLLGASAPGLIDVVARLPGLSLALNYRLVFLAALGLAGLAAFGAEEIARGASRSTLAAALLSCALLLIAASLFSRGVFRDRGLAPSFVRFELACEVVPLVTLAVAVVFGGRAPRSSLVAAACAVLAAERALEMGGVYPSLSASLLAPPLQALASSPAEPVRIAAAGDVFRPNAAALYGVEDARGYESLVLDRFADTYPLWSEPQPASFNRVDRLDRPFLSFLNVRFAIGAPRISPPPGWIARASGDVLTLFENPRALPRAFAPRRLRSEFDSRVTLREMAAASAADFAELAWVASRDLPAENPTAAVSCREIGADLLVTTESAAPVFVATSLPDWPGWRATTDRDEELPLATVNHAFVGFRAPQGRREIRLRYRPRSFDLGVGVFAAGFVGLAVVGVARTARWKRPVGAGLGPARRNGTTLRSDNVRRSRVASDNVP